MSENILVDEKENQKKLIYDEILNKLHVNLEKYKQLDEELWNYNLEDNLEDSLVSLINNDEYGYDKQDLKATIYTLKKLGLERLIPKIEEVEKDRESKSYNKSWNLTNSEKSEIQSKAKKLADKIKERETEVSIAAIQSSFASNVFSSPSSFARITRHFSFSPGCRSSQPYSPSKICFSFHMIYAPYWDSEIHSCSSFIPFCNI